MNNRKLKKINKGFTLIETLVAISILMIAIAGPLTVANKGYTSSLDAKNQSVAINLAQEGIEYINYIKDNRDWGQWDRNTSFVDTVIESYSLCKIDNACSFPSGSITDLPNNFTRTFYFIESEIGNQISVVVKVSWTNGSVTNDVTLQQILTNYER